MSLPPEPTVRRPSAVRRFALVQAASVAIKIAAVVALLLLVSKLVGGL
jgi:hypothetical protein